MKKLLVLSAIVCAFQAQATTKVCLAAFVPNKFPINLGIDKLIPQEPMSFEENSVVIIEGRPVTKYSDVIKGPVLPTPQDKEIQLGRLDDLMGHPIDSQVVNVIERPTFREANWKGVRQLFVQRTFTEWFTQEPNHAFNWFIETIGKPEREEGAPVSLIVLLVRESNVIRQPFLLAIKPMHRDLFRGTDGIYVDFFTAGIDTIYFENIAAVYYMTPKEITK